MQHNVFDAMITLGFVDYGIFDLESSFINVNPRGFAHFCIHMRILNILSAAIMHLCMY